MIPAPVHAVLDAVSAAALVAAPRVFSAAPPVARGLVAGGVGLAAVSLLTRYGADRKVPVSMRAHLGIDAAQGIAALVAAAALRTESSALRLALAGYGAFSLAVVAASDARPALGTRQLPLPTDAIAGHPAPDGTVEVAPDVACLRVGIVNVAFIGHPDAGDRGWVLVDAGLPGSAEKIRAAAARRFGPDARPAAILLTHGHFDHVGALDDLARDWQVPVWAHRAERPYLDGHRAYPPPNPRAGGLMAAASPRFPRGPVDVRLHLHDLPPDGKLPALAGWRWIATPGHSAGHVSFFRDADRLLISGDAIITTRQEDLLPVLRQKPELHGPPAYFTPDWLEAAESIQRLAALRPALILSGHGRPVCGPAMEDAVQRLSHEVLRIAIPRGEGVPRLS